MKKRFILKSSTRIETTFNKHLNFAYYYINRYKINSYGFRVLINLEDFHINYF
ncbi:MAG: hypothetical protein IAC58_03895 [Firmicutes bacterium]|uniref:Uncharacterized protein n=1 Tax=Candidatus Onthovivens merdipullorum TaxID=2840889 RepID=A0A9D9DIY3_9BACL|nr:hypothetical protein [Candidatus Onthovivens merdipullorum]